MKSKEKHLSKMEKILIVDDEKNIIASLRRLLSAYFSFYGALTVSEGFKILEKEDIAVVISDYRMPEIDGIQFLSEVQEKFPEISKKLE